MICVVVIFDMLNTIFRDVIRLRISNKNDVKPTIALVLLGSLLAIIIIIILISNIIKLCSSRCSKLCSSRCSKLCSSKCSVKKVIIVSLQTLAVCCYFFGDNFYYIMNRYGGCISGCGIDCIQNSYVVAVGFSGAAAMIYAIVKVFQLTIKDNSRQSKEKEEWINFLPMIAVIAEMDVLYTIASSKITGTRKTAATSCLLGIAIIIGIALIIGKIKIQLKKIDEWNNQTNIIPINEWIKKLDDKDSIDKEIGQWNINDMMRGLPDQLSDNKFILMKDDVDNDNEHSKLANYDYTMETLRQDLIVLQKYLAIAQERPNAGVVDSSAGMIDSRAANLNNLKDSLTTIETSLTSGIVSQDFKSLKINYMKYFRKIIISCFLIIIALALHTLGDNLEPLDSADKIMCISPDFEHNSTVICRSEESCRKNSIIRLCLGSISLIIIVGFGLYCFINWLKSMCRPKTQEEMDQYKRHAKQARCQRLCCCWQCYPHDSVSLISEAQEVQEAQEAEEAQKTEAKATQKAKVQQVQLQSRNFPK